MRTILACLSLAAILTPASAGADDIEMSGNAGVVSDYRFRGVSLSDRDPALQAGLDLEAGALFAGAWASSIADYEGAEMELDIYGGLQGTIGPFGWRAGAYTYLYPGGSEVNYVELIGQVDRAFGPITLGAEAALAPRQGNVPVANRYLGGSASYDLGDSWSVSARGGYEDGFYDGKWDWELGVAYTTGPLQASLAYVDTDHDAPGEAGRLAAAGLVGSLVAQF